MRRSCCRPRSPRTPGLHWFHNSNLLKYIDLQVGRSYAESFSRRSFFFAISVMCSFTEKTELVLNKTSLSPGNLENSEIRFPVIDKMMKYVPESFSPSLSQKTEGTTWSSDADECPCQVTVAPTWYDSSLTLPLIARYV